MALHERYVDSCWVDFKKLVVVLTTVLFDKDILLLTHVQRDQTEDLDAFEHV